MYYSKVSGLRMFSNVLIDVLIMPVCYILLMHLIFYLILCSFIHFYEVKWKLLSHVRLSGTPRIVHGILQARILEWVAVPFSRGSSQHRDWTQVFCVAGRFFISWATRGEISFRIKLQAPYALEICSEDSNKTSRAPGDPTETEQDLPLSVLVSPMEVRVSSGPSQGQGIWVQ